MIPTDEFRGTFRRLFGLVLSMSRGSPPIYVFGKSYNPLSGGVRSLHLLCHHLNRAGFEAYVTGSKVVTRLPGLNTPVLTAAIEAKHKADGREPIVVYPEVTRGNPLGVTIVVRYLLNRPGLFAPGVVETFGPDDLFFHFAPEHVIPGTRSFDLFMPLVDRSIHSPPPADARRGGFVVVSKRVSPDPSTFPPWVAPILLVSHAQPIPAPELADLYRRSRAMVTFERSAAIFEAELCGCPVICIPGEHFREETYQPRFKGLGLVWGWDERRLSATAVETAGFRAIYTDIEKNIGDRLKAAVAWVLNETRERPSR